MNCAEVRELLSASLDGEIEPLPAEAQTHYDSCSECQRAKEEYTQLDDRLSSLYSAGFESGAVAAVTTVQRGTHPVALPTIARIPTPHRVHDRNRHTGSHS